MHNFKKHFTSTLLQLSALSMLVLMLFPLRAGADITKTDLQAQIKQQVAMLLLKDNNDDMTTQKQNFIAARSQHIAETIAALPETAVSDDLAQWIQESILAIIKHNLSTVMQDTPKGNAFVNGFTTLAKARFSTLDNAKGKQILIKRKLLLASGQMYRQQLKSFLVKNLATVDIVRLNIAITAEPAFNNDILSKVIRDLNLGGNAVLFGDTKPAEEDVSADPIDSQMLTLALIKDIDDQLSEEVLGDSFSYGNLFSEAFIDGDPYHTSNLKSFAETQPVVEKIYKNCVVTLNQTSIIDLYLFNKVVFDSVITRLLPPPKRSWTNRPPAYLTFVNNKASWKLTADQLAE